MISLQHLAGQVATNHRLQRSRKRKLLVIHYTESPASQILVLRERKKTCYLYKVNVTSHHHITKHSIQRTRVYKYKGSWKIFRLFDHPDNNRGTIKLRAQYSSNDVQRLITNPTKVTYNFIKTNTNRKLVKIEIRNLGD